ncbi:MAG: selenium cofactor biosynthesis protein YqeC [Caldilineaceae bacterium]
MDLIHSLRLDPSLPTLAPSTVRIAPAGLAVVTVIGGGGKTSLVFRLAREVVARGGRVVTATTTRVAVRQLEQAPALLRLSKGQLAPDHWDGLKRALDDHQHCFVVGNETLLNGKQAGVEPEVIDALAAQAGPLGINLIVVEGDGSRTLPVKAPAEHEPVIPASTTLVLSTLGLDAIGAPLDEAHAHRPERIRALLGLPPTGPERLTPAQAATLLLHPEGGAKGRPPGARLLPVLNKADVAAHLAPARLAAAQLAAQGAASLLAAAGNAAQPPGVERWGPIAAVVLAAGGSSRFGSPKQLALVNGQTLVERAARTALASSAEQVLVVTGAEADAVNAVLAPLIELAGHRLQIVHNAEWASGQSSSLRRALIHLMAQPVMPEALLCLPVDQPWLEASLLRRLVRVWRSGADLAAPLATDTDMLLAGANTTDVRGAPAIFDCTLFGELLAVAGDTGGRDLLRRHRDRLVTVPADARSLVDVDSPSDLI